MADFTTNKIDGNQVAATEWNQLADIDNAIINATGNPSTGDLNQLSKAMAANAATATFYTDSGTANNYVLTPIGNFKTPFSYTDGMEVRFRPANNSSGTSQVSVGTLGAKTIKLEDGATNISTEITTSNDVKLRYDATSDYFFFIKTIPITATETSAGIAEIATAAEAAAAVADDKIITPLKQRIVQVVNYQTGAVATSTSDIPNDDTIPQITEGTEYMTLAITPKNSTNKLKIDVVFCAKSDVAEACTVALFQDSTANALAAVQISLSDAGAGVPATVFSHYMTASTVSSTTFRVRAGGATGGGGTITFNGSGGSRLLGGVMASSITITEIKA